MNRLKIAILMGSDSDLEVMEITAKTLSEFGVQSEMHILSAHRTPHLVAQFAGEAETKGFGAIIAGAGGAAHLAGVIAAHTVLPVIGVPMDATSLKGMDSLLSTVQMPAGIPVATVAIGKPGARNAALLAVQILAVHDDDLRQKYRAFKKDMALKVEARDKQLQNDTSK